jgi:Fur family transcriptional regulator, peroxide stress response regulator
VEQYMKILKDYGLRVTPQRKLIIEFLSRTRSHPTAESIFEEIKDCSPALSLNTVYKTLEIFEQRGMVRKFNIGFNIYHYDANMNPHSHIVCTNCKRVDDINGNLSNLGERFIKEVESNSDYEVFYSDLFFYGHCKDCRHTY